MEEVLTAIASGLRLDAEQFIADFKNGDDFLKEKEIAEKLASFIPEKVRAANETAKKVRQSEINKRLSRLIKSSGFENPEGLEGEPLFSAFIEWKGEQTAHIDGEPKGMTKDELLKLPVVKSIVNEVTAKAGERFAAERKALEEKVAMAEDTRKSILLDKYAREIAAKAKARLGDDPETEAFRLGVIKSHIPLRRVEIADGDKIRFLGDDGFETDLEPVVVKVVTASGWVQKQDPAKGGANPVQNGAKGAQGGDYVPTHNLTTPQEYDTALKGAVSNEERFEVMKSWRHLQQQRQQAAGK